METNTLENSLSELIINELEKRGIFTKVKECKVDWDKKRVSFETEPFRTTPTIFKKIWISDFGSSITKTNNDNIFEMFVNLDYRYNPFEGGSNGNHLMTIVFNYFVPSNSLRIKSAL